MGVGGEGHGHAELGGQLHDGRAGVDLAAGLAQPGGRDLHGHARIAQLGEGRADDVEAAGLVEPDVEAVHGEDLDKVGVGGDLEHARGDHLAPALEVAHIVPLALFLRKDVPVRGLVVEAPVTDEMHAAQQIVEIIGGAGLAGKVRLPFQPVHLHAEQHLAGIGSGVVAQLADLAGIGGHEAAQLFAVFVGIVEAQRTRGMFGEAQQFEPGRAGGGVHLLGRAGAVGITGMAVEVGGDHDGLRERPGLSGTDGMAVMTAGRGRAEMGAGPEGKKRGGRTLPVMC